MQESKHKRSQFCKSIRLEASMKYGLLTIVPILLNALVGKQSGAVILVSFIAVVGIIHAARLISGEGKIYDGARQSG